MKKLIPIIIVLAVVQNWSKIQNWMNPIDYSNLAAGTVVMYGTDWCPYCKKMKVFFDERGIVYVEYNVEQSEKRNQEFKQLGGRGVPLVVVGEEVIRGYNPDAVTVALKTLN